MKPRKWIIVVCLLILASVSGLYIGKRSLERNRNIEQLLVQHVSPAVGGTFAVEKVRIGFFAVVLSGVQIVIPLQSFSLNVQDIKIGFSFFKLLITRGDITQSINKIILVGPELDIALSPPGKKKNEQAVPQKNIAINAFPVEHLLVKNCTVRLINQKEEKLTVGEQLTGRIWEEESTLHFELRGKCAAKRRNLFLSGVFSPKTKQQHISVRLDKAQIDKPIRWQKFSVVKGKFDGVCEISFSDTTFPHNIDAHGMMSIENGIGTIDGIAENISQVKCRVSCEGNTIIVDTLTAQWHGITALCRGVTGISPEQESKFALHCTGIDPRTFPGLPEGIQKELSGYGWIVMKALRKRDASLFAAEITAGGITIGDETIQRIVGRGSFGNGNVVIDTLFCDYPGASCGVAGLINFEKSPVVYSFSLGLCGKAETFLSGCTGGITATGDVHGLGDDLLVTLLAKGKNITYANLDLGNPLISVIKRKQTVIITSKKTPGERFSCSGTLDSISLDKPLLSFDVQIYKPLLQNLVAAMAGESAATLDSGSAALSITGRVPNPAVNATVQCRAKNVQGTGTFHFSRADTAQPYAWQVQSEDMYVADSLFPFRASGEFRGDTVRIKTFSSLGSITGSGTIQTGSSGNIDVAVACKNVPLDKMNFLFPGDERLIQKGFINGTIHVFGRRDNLKSSSQLNIRKFSVAGITALATDAVIRSSGKEWTVLPFVIRKNKRVICKVDSVIQRQHLSFSGEFDKIDLAELLGTVLPPDYKVRGFITGNFATSSTGLPVQATLNAPRILLNEWQFNSVNAVLSLTKNGITVTRLSAVDSIRSALKAYGNIPWSFMNNTIQDTDTLHATINVTGDLLASLEHNVESVVGGRGKGEISVDFAVTADQWHFNKAYASIPKGILTVDPYLPDKVKNFTLSIRMDEASRLHVSCGGNVDKRPITISNTHRIPRGFEPLLFGPLNCGILLVKTPKNGIPIFVLGFMERKDQGDIEFAPRPPFDAFALAGPADKFRIYGTWVLRNTQFTFPLLEEEPLPPHLRWDLDIRAGNRKVVYFYNVGGKRRRLMRFTEAFIEPSSTIVKVRGREIDGSLKILGRIRSYRGSVFYGREFDRNYEVGVDFAPQKLAGGAGYDNLPIIWGSAEAFSDSSRFDRIKLTLLVRDPKTGGLSEKGRFHDITFRVSSDFEEIPGEAEQEFYREAGLNFITFKQAGRKAGEMVSSMGDQYINRYFLQRIERKLARRVGLDVFTFETSIASNYFNYFYNNPDHLERFTHQWEYLAFANVGVTLGRYIMRDKLLLKWRTELIGRELLLTPEHSIGFEYQPMDYFWVDFNYGFFRNEADIVESNPKLRMQLRLPITGLRKFFDF